MNATEKYLFQVKLDTIRDTAPLSDTDLDAMLETTGTTTDPAKRNPNPLTAGGMADMLGDIIQQRRRAVLTLCGMMGLDCTRVVGAFDAAEGFGDADPLNALYDLLEHELGRRGPVARRLTRWLVKHAFSFVAAQDAGGWDRDQLVGEMVAHLDSERPEYAGAVHCYFDPEREALDTDDKLLACCILFDLDAEGIEERAAIIEFDTGLTRTTATMRAVWFALRNRHPRISEAMAGVLFDLSAAALEHEQVNDWRHSETVAWIMDQLHGEDVTPLALPQNRVAV